MDSASFAAQARNNPINDALLRRLKSLALNDCYLTAGCLFQSVWNQHAGLPPQHAIKDYDVFYFDDRDLSWESEDAVIRRVNAACSDLGVAIEVKNQARVHLWYEQKFGTPYPQLKSSRDGIDRYLVSCTCVGIAAASQDVHAPNGLDDMANGVLRMNPVNPNPVLFARKAEDYRARWPWLQIVY